MNDEYPYENNDDISMTKKIILMFSGIALSIIFIMIALLLIG